SSAQLQEVEPEEYYEIFGHDCKPLRVPSDLDQSICLYQQLSAKNRARFDRASFWVDLAWRQWTLSVSASFASLVSAIESVTERGKPHRLYCDDCNSYRTHELPGSTEKFRDFFETYAPGASLEKRRNDMYSLRSGILHGSRLMEFDLDHAFGSDPPWYNDYH